MEPLQIKSKTNTKLKSILWGTSFILLGLAMEAAMIGLIVTEGFSFIYVFGMLLFTLLIWAGFASIHRRKYPLELLADGKGIHYYDYDSKFGYGKHEFIIPWETIKAVTRYTDRDFDPEDWEYEALSIQSLEFALENQGNEAQYTPMQKNAALCFWYHAEVCGEGHLGYFHNWENVIKTS